MNNEEKIKGLQVIKQDPKKEYLVVRLTIAHVKLGLFGKDEVVGFSIAIPNTAKDAISLFEELDKKIDDYASKHKMIPY